MAAFIKPTNKLQNLDDPAAQRYVDTVATSVDAISAFINNTFTAGIPAILDMGSLGGAALAVGTAFSTVNVIILTGATFEFTTATWRATHPGSIIGVSVNSGVNNTGAYTVTPAVNGVAKTALQTAYNNAGAGSAALTAKKGIVTFNAGDVITVPVVMTTAGNPRAYVRLTVCLDPPIPA